MGGWGLPGPQSCHLPELVYRPSLRISAATSTVWPCIRPGVLLLALLVLFSSGIGPEAGGFHEASLASSPTVFHLGTWGLATSLALAEMGAWGGWVPSILGLLNGNGGFSVPPHPPNWLDWAGLRAPSQGLLSSYPLSSPRKPSFSGSHQDLGY